MLDPGATYIERLSIRSRRGRAAALRVHLALQLRTLDLSPSGLPPAALLLVRQVTDPLPGSLSARPSSRVSPRWQCAIRERVDQAVRNAARPVRGRVPASAASALFVDESELLACLALAAARGELATHWCWPLALRRHASGSRARLEALLIANARLVPAVIAQLVLWGQCHSVVAGLRREEIEDLVRALSLEHSLAIDGAPVGDAAITGWDAPGVTLAARMHPDRSVVPWRTWLRPDQGHRWEPQAELFVGLALMVHYQPVQARSPLFRAQLRAWWRGLAISTTASGSAHGEADSTGLDEMPRPGRDRRAMIEQGSEEALRNEGAGPGSSPSDPAPVVAPAARAAAVARPIRTLRRDRLEATLDSGEAPSRGSEYPQPSAEPPTPEHPALPGPCHRDPSAHPSNGAIGDLADASDHGDPTVSGPDVAAESPEDWATSGVATRLGGALYLINLLRHLELPSCFEPSWGFARDLGPWGLLELLTRALLAESHDDYANDALWCVLAELDGRAPRQWPGEAVGDNDAYRIPEDWLVEPIDASSWAATDRRLRLWAPQAFLLVDVPRGGQPAAVQAVTEARRYPGPYRLTPAPFDAAPSESLSEKLQGMLNPAIAFWLSSVMPYIRWRLAQATPAAMDPCGDLLLLSGRLYVTRTHIDLVSSLEGISLPARLAGLDRDPGWAGEWGRVVSFHFQ